MRLPTERGAIATICMSALLGCSSLDQEPTISREGPGLFYRASGAVQLIDLSDGRLTYGFLNSPALDELNPKMLFAGVPENCLVVVYRLKAEGRLVKERSIYATKLTLIQPYTRRELEAELRRIDIEALNDPQVCPSA